MGFLPIGREAQEARDIDHGPVGVRGVRRDEVEHLAGELQEPVKQGEGTVTPRPRLELFDDAEQAAESGARGRLGGDGDTDGPVVGRLRLDVPAGHDVPDGVDEMPSIELGHARDVQDLQRIQAPRSGGHHPRQRDVIVRVRDRPEALLQVTDLGGGEQRQAARDRVWDVLVTQTGDDGVAVLVLAVQDCHVRPMRVVGIHPGADRVHDGHGLVLRPGTRDELDGVAGRPLRPEALVRFVARCVALDEAVRGGEHMPDRAEVLLDTHPRGWSGRRTIRVMRGRHRKPTVELAERGIARATESIDRLVVVANDHHVVGTVRRPAQQLDELDLGDVGVLELVHEQVAELALPAPEQVRSHLEQLRDGSDHLAIVERATGDQLRLIRTVDGREFGQAHHLQGGAVDDVGVREFVDRG